MNSFSEEELFNRGSRVRCRVSIFDIISRLNHSCESNVDNFFDENGMMYCVANRSIKKGDQVFIDYLGGERYSSPLERRNVIEKI